MRYYLTDKVFNTYFSGVYNGKIVFRENYVELHSVDRRTRVQLKAHKLTMRNEDVIDETMIDYAKIHSTLDAYCECKWDTDRVKLANGSIYERYRKFEGKANGKDVTVYLWAQRQCNYCTDLLVCNNEIVGFINPGRICSEITVLEGFEDVSPLLRFKEGNLSEAKYGVNPLGSFMVKTRDGVDLATLVFLPEGMPEGTKVPTIVIRTCYEKETDILRTWHWVARGYAFVVQDVRGRNDSGGAFEPFQHERDDAYDLFDWIAAQKWSNGKIGMWGASYLGFTTTAAATSGHPNLVTAVSEVNVGSPFADVIRRGGAVSSWTLLCWALAQSVGNRIDYDVFLGSSVSPEEAIRYRPINDIATKMIGKRCGPWDNWSKHYHYDDFWKYSDNTLHAKNIKIPMLIMSGWYDDDNLGVQETWRFLTECDVPGRRIVLGPWEHHLNSWRDCLDFSFGNNAIDYDFDTRIIRWFDHYLKGVDNGEDRKPRATYYVEGENKWRTSDDWNPVESKLTKLYFDSDGHANSSLGDGKLTLSVPEEEKTDNYVFDPEQPCSGVIDITTPYKCSERQLRNDVLVYDSPVLEKDVPFAGNVSAEIYASSSAVDTDFFVRLSDVDEKGVSRNLCNNLIRAEFRKGWDSPELLTPGKVEKYDIILQFYGFVFKKGHKIRVEVCSSDEWVVFPNTNTGIDPYLDPKPVIARQTIYHGGKYPSCIKLPLLTE